MPEKEAVVVKSGDVVIDIVFEQEKKRMWKTSVVTGSNG